MIHLYFRLKNINGDFYRFNFFQKTHFLMGNELRTMSFLQVPFFFFIIIMIILWLCIFHGKNLKSSTISSHATCRIQPNVKYLFRICDFFFLYSSYGDRWQLKKNYRALEVPLFLRSLRLKFRLKMLWKLVSWRHIIEALGISLHFWTFRSLRIS